MDQNGHFPPTYRFQPPIATTRRRQPPSDSTILIFFLVILFSLFLFFFLPPPLSHIPKIIKPTPVKSNWGSLIIFLFLFAILTGVFAQRNDTPSRSNVTTRLNRSAPESYRNRKVQVNCPSMEPVSGDNRHRPRQGEPRKMYSRVEESIEVVRNVPQIMIQRQSPKRLRPPPPPATALAPPVPVDSRRRRASASIRLDETIQLRPPPPPVPVDSRRRRTSGSVGLDETIQITSQINRSHEDSQFPPPPRPPPPPPATSGNRNHRLQLNDNELDQAETAPTTASLDDQRKRNQKHRHKSRDVHQTPPPQSTVQPPSPPSQPKSSPLRRRPASTQKPPLPTKTSNYNDRDDFNSSGSHSQSSWTPIAPPPPPFRLPARKFELRGHYVRLRSVHSSDFSSPDRDNLPSTIIDGGDSFGPSPISFRSPDVNAKADRFISRLKDKWRLENQRKQAQAHKQAQNKAI